MKQSSLRLRLSMAAAVSIITALTISGIFLKLLFERHLIRRVDQELAAYTKQLVAALTFTVDGQAELATQLADPRFARPFSGLYWQIEGDRKVVLHSRSLWNQVLRNAQTPEKEAGPPKTHEIAGPNNERMFARTRLVFIATPTGDREFRITTAVDKSDFLSARAAFSRDLAIALGLLAAALLAAAWLQITIGLKPLNQIRQRINDIRTGSASQLEGTYPDEVHALVEELNALLQTQDMAVKRARDSAADLAHGLKTPLAVLHAESRTLRNRELFDVAEEIDTRVEQMRERVERHLAIARLRGPEGNLSGKTDAKHAFGKIVHAMSRMPRGDEINWNIDLPAHLMVPLDSHDFYEVFGNLLDNARKWARAEVSIAGRRTEKLNMIHIDDDGPGVPSEQIAEIFARGERLDENKQGSGLGLAIARQVLTAYGAELSIENRSEGGLRTTVSLPND